MQAANLGVEFRLFYLLSVSTYGPAHGIIVQIIESSELSPARLNTKITCDGTFICTYRAFDMLN